MKRQQEPQIENMRPIKTMEGIRKMRKMKKNCKNLTAYFFHRFLCLTHQRYGDGRNGRSSDFPEAARKLEESRKRRAAMMTQVAFVQRKCCVFLFIFYLFSMYLINFQVFDGFLAYVFFTYVDC